MPPHQPKGYLDQAPGPLEEDSQSAKNRWLKILAVDHWGSLQNPVGSLVEDLLTQMGASHQVKDRQVLAREVEDHLEVAIPRLEELTVAPVAAKASGSPVVVNLAPVAPLVAECSSAMAAGGRLAWCPRAKVPSMEPSTAAALDLLVVVAGCCWANWYQQPHPRPLHQSRFQKVAALQPGSPQEASELEREVLELAASRLRVAHPNASLNPSRHQEYQRGAQRRLWFCPTLRSLRRAVAP